MKTRSLASVVLAVAFLLAGCATTFRPWKLSEIHPGMSKADVQLLLGTPDIVTADRGLEYMHYFYSEDLNPPLSPDSPIEFEATQRFRHEEIIRSLKRYHYVIELKNDVVVNYSERSN